MKSALFLILLLFVENIFIFLLLLSFVSHRLYTYSNHITEVEIDDCNADIKCKNSKIIKDTFNKINFSHPIQTIRNINKISRTTISTIYSYINTQFKNRRSGFIIVLLC
ncbi:hypothetical protein DN407_30470 (plasmid) [Bacillus sp. JAS24-2]|nr:hypothetical protein DN407_30470 [Bacillus sp. JAS24-2]